MKKIIKHSKELTISELVKQNEVGNLGNAFIFYYDTNDAGKYPVFLKMSEQRIVKGACWGCVYEFIAPIISSKPAYTRPTFEECISEAQLFKTLYFCEGSEFKQIFK